MAGRLPPKAAGARFRVTLGTPRDPRAGRTRRLRQVYRGRDTRLDREVALKILLRRPRAAGRGGRAEARLLARIGSPNVVTVYGADRVEGWSASGWNSSAAKPSTGSTKRRVHSREAALIIGLDLCHALSAVHAAGISHRDVKLTNMMSADGGRIVLMDFGLGREGAATVAEPPVRIRRRGSREHPSSWPPRCSRRPPGSALRSLFAGRRPLRPGHRLPSGDGLELFPVAGQARSGRAAARRDLGPDFPKPSPARFASSHPTPAIDTPVQPMPSRPSRNPSKALTPPVRERRPACPTGCLWRWTPSWDVREN